MDEVAIKVKNLSKDFVLPHQRPNSVKSLFTGFYKKNALASKEIHHALKDVSFEIKKGEFFGIVGRNGSGKSTLLKILAGIYQPTNGKVYANGKLVPFIELGVGFNPDLTGRENVYLNGAMLGFNTKQVDEMYQKIVDFAELERFMDQKLKNYSSGMQVRLAFSMAIRAKADILLIDEVLAVGDADFQRKCYEYFRTLKKGKKTVVFISHDMGAIREFCDRAMLIDDSKCRSIGETTKIASQYSQLFIEEIDEQEPQEEVFKESNRWGNGKIKIEKAQVSLAGNEVVIKVEAKAKQNLEGVLYGLHITAQDGSEVTAMNNRMLLQPDLKIDKANSKINFVWTMLNIFNDGKYFVSLTLVDDVGVAYDWFNEAASFTIKRPERSTTSVLPPVEVKYKII